MPLFANVSPCSSHSVAQAVIALGRSRAVVMPSDSWPGRERPQLGMEVLAYGWLIGPDLVYSRCRIHRAGLTDR